MIVRNFVTPKLIKQLSRLHDNCRALHIPPPPVTYIKTEVSDIESGELEFSQFEKANSFVRNYYNSLARQGGFLMTGNETTFGAGYLNQKDTGGDCRGVYSTYAAYYTFPASSAGGAGSLAAGIIAGTAETAESFESYNLGTPIAHGTGAGQLSYAAGSYGTPSYNAGTKKWTVNFTRVLSNTSGGTITIKELGFVADHFNQSANRSILIDRSVLASPIDVANNKKITITYTFEMTFPS